MQHNKDKKSIKIKLLHLFQGILIKLIPFKNRFTSHFSFDSDEMFGVDYHCIGFKKLSNDERKWDWFERF